MLGSLSLVLWTVLLCVRSLVAAPTNSPPACPVCSASYDANFRELLYHAFCVPLVTGSARPSLRIILSNPAWKKAHVVPQFDDLAVEPGGLRVSNTPPPTPYKGLAYGNLSVSSTPLVMPGVVPHTRPNYAVLAGGQGPPTASLNTAFPDSKTLTFDLKSFWFGCKTTGGGQGNGNPAEQCTLQAKGYKQSRTNPSVCDIAGVRDPLLAISVVYPPRASIFCSERGFASTRKVMLTRWLQPVTFSFLPGLLGLYDQPMVQAKLDSTFSGLTNVTITLVSQEIPLLSVITLLDNFNHTTHSVCCP